MWEKRATKWVLTGLLLTFCLLPEAKAALLESEDIPAASAELEARLEALTKREADLEAQSDALAQRETADEVRSNTLAERETALDASSAAVSNLCPIMRGWISLMFAVRFKENPEVVLRFLEAARLRFSGILVKRQSLLIFFVQAEIPIH